MDLQTVLAWVISGGGAGILAYLALEEFGEFLEPKVKRYLAIAFTAVLGGGAYALAVWAGYVPTPVDAQGWIEALSPVLFAAFGLSQIIHGERNLDR